MSKKDIQSKITKITHIWDFLCGPLAQTLSSQCRGPRFIPWSENLTLHAATKELHDATKIKDQRSRMPQLRLSTAK